MPGSYEGRTAGRTRPPQAPRRDPADDVVAAHAGASRAATGFGPRNRRPPRRTLGDRLHGFVARWGWRAYAIPILAVVTVVALMSSTSGSAAPRKKPVAAAASGAASKAPVLAPAHISLKDDAPGAGAVTKVPKGFALPAGAAYATQGKGTFRTLKGTAPVVGTHGKLFRYSVDVENGVDDIDLTQFQDTVVRVLSDKRSWSGHDVRLQRVDSGDVDFHVTLTSSLTTRKFCGYSIPVETSCYAAQGSVAVADVNRVVFNDSRWVRGSTAYLGDLASYREYMINHEDGHALGHEHAHQCLPDGLAPVMMQQTFGLRSSVTKQMCQANPWPYPTGVKGTPGKEQPDTPANDEFGLAD